MESLESGARGRGDGRGREGRCDSLHERVGCLEEVEAERIGLGGGDNSFVLPGERLEDLLRRIAALRARSGGREALHCPSDKRKNRLGRFSVLVCTRDLSYRVGSDRPNLLRQPHVRRKCILDDLRCRSSIRREERGEVEREQADTLRPCESALEGCRARNNGVQELALLDVGAARLGVREEGAQGVVDRWVGKRRWERGEGEGAQGDEQVGRSVERGHSSSPLRTARRPASGRRRLDKVNGQRASLRTGSTFTVHRTRRTAWIKH